MYSQNKIHLELRICILVAIVLLMMAINAYAKPISVEYHFDFPEIKEVSIEGEVYHRINMPDAPSGGNPGEPALPSIGARILIPYGRSVETIEIVAGERIYLDEGFRVEPIGTSMPLSGDPLDYSPSAPIPAIYSSLAIYPEARYDFIGVHDFRGYKVLILSLHPMEYLPASGQLWYYSGLEVLVTTTAADKTPSLYRGLSKDMAEVASKVDNPGETSSYSAEAKSGDQNFDLLILTMPGLASAFQPLKDYHDSTGVATEIFTMLDVGGFSPEDVREFIREKYLNDGIQYVLLGDDDAFVPIKYLYVEALVYDQVGVVEPRMPSDLYYACLDGTYDYDGDGRYGEPTDGEGGGDVDLIADVYVGRAAVDNSEDAERFVNKTIRYLSSSDPYLNEVVMCSEDLYYPGAKHYGYIQMEEIVDGASTHGYTTAGIPSDLYTIDRMYDYYWPGSWSGLELMDRIAGNVHIVNHLGHCNYEYAMRMTPVEALVLTNPEPCFIYTQGCYAGGFDTLDAECMAEMFTVKSEWGAFAAIMNARLGWVEVGAHPDTHDGASQRYNREFWDAVFNPAENKPEIGRANHDSKEDNLYRINDGAMRWCYYETNLFGDPTVRIKRPTGLLFDYPAGIPSTSPPGQSVSLQVNVAGLYDGIPIEASGQIHYSINGGDVNTISMTELSPNRYEAELPALECGDTLGFYFSAEELTTGRLYDPPPDSGNIIVPVRRAIVAFEDDFETDKGWNVSGGLWERGMPMGGGGEKGWPDPVSGTNGPAVFGYNLSGDYENNLPARYLTSPSIDCSYLENVYLEFDRWLGVEHIPWDHASLEISTDGSNWNPIWSNPGIVQDSQWTAMNYDISAYAAYKPMVYLRWSMGPTNQVFHYCGWNIDNVRVVSYDCLGYYCGDANTDGTINVGDAVTVINYVFRGGDPPNPPGAGDANGDGACNVGDAVFLISYVFKGGPVPVCP